MTKRTSIKDVSSPAQLSDLDLIVKDKRKAKRAPAKQERRDRHYVKVLIKDQLKQCPEEEV